jgi:hypothetical protein
VKISNWPLRLGLLAGVLAIAVAGVSTPSQAQRDGRNSNYMASSPSPHQSRQWHGDGDRGYGDRSRYRGARDDWRRPDWRYSGVRRFDRDHWRRGHWYHGWRGDRLAWWWTFDNDWYAYDAPVYPYPDPDTPPPAYYDPNAAQPQMQPPPAPPVAAGQSPLVYDPYTGQYKPQNDGGSHYYCYNPAGYYPDVTDCPGGWVARPPG